MSKVQNGRKRYEISCPLGISVDDSAGQGSQFGDVDLRPPQESGAKVVIFTHKPRTESDKGTKNKWQMSSSNSLPGHENRTHLSICNDEISRDSALRGGSIYSEYWDIKATRDDPDFSEECKSDIRVIRSFDEEFINEIFSRDQEQLSSFSLGEQLNHALYEETRKRESVNVAKLEIPAVIMKSSRSEGKRLTFAEDTKSEPSRLKVQSKGINMGIDFTRSCYRYTRSWKKKHKLASSIPLDDMPACLGDHIPIRTKPVESSQGLHNNSSSARHLLECLRPINVELEKLKFFARDFDYNPQFKYLNPLTSEFLSQYRKPSVKYLKPALTILRNLIRRYGSYERYEELTGGRVLQPNEIRALVTDYVQREGFDDGEILLNMSTSILSTAMMSRAGGHGVLTVKVGEMHESWIEGMLRHELSTHYLRGKNNTHQPWSSRRCREHFSLLPHNPTEEGLASLHTVLMRPEPLLFRNALLYYAIVLAATLSFKDLFSKLAEFVSDPEKRWEYCVRAKRGQYDTSVPGCFTKDQVYLAGSLNILHNRKRIDFEALMRCGKLAWEDVERVKGLADYENTRIPSFMRDMAFYRSRLDFILKINGLRDADFKSLKGSSSSGSETDRIDECRFDI
ncbi:microtubule-associated tyrosine carboxypeptidase 1-like [Convolutriloba macropyga]|uniref:microtubule-associated tyrosine carboxypeptidase 1-like n=1 Tax=Convolutriloba macropyga TaxID=536237 RepID=UPI003F524CDC